ncbi:MAG: SH3 domain-containing protein [Gammaproteobacteria bacterium]|nr:SH3 domain-containing protein [Gammaproteobacteria bacterium]MDH5592960.1 SH3 domain-containing protein [Gammaproteobacteria bacterium]
MYRYIIRIRILLVCFFAGISTLHAATGDVFYITGSLVNIRASATTESAIVTRISKGRKVEEVTRQSGWVKVKIIGTDKQGWVHTALLNYRMPELSPDEKELISHGPLQRETPETKKTVTEKLAVPEVVEKKMEPNVPVVSTDPFEKFINGFNLFKDKKMVNQGASQFGEVDDKGDGVLHISVTEDWLKNPLQTRKQDLKQIFDIWYSARSKKHSAVYLMEASSSIPAAIYIKDKKGKIHTAVRK